MWGIQGVEMEGVFTYIYLGYKRYSQVTPLQPLLPYKYNRMLNAITRHPLFRYTKGSTNQPTHYRNWVTLSFSLLLSLHSKGVIYIIKSTFNNKLSQL